MKERKYIYNSERAIRLTDLSEFISSRFEPFNYNARNPGTY